MTRKKHPPILTVRSEHFVHDPFPAGIIYYKGDSRWLIPGWEATRQGCSTTSNHVPDKRTPPLLTLNALIFAGLKFREFREGQFFGYFAGIKFREFRDQQISKNLVRI